MIDLGVLEFKAEDFKRTFSPPMGDDDLQFIADDANKKLRERLEKALKVYATEGTESADDGIWMTEHDPELDCHAARIVCITKLNDAPTV